MLCSYSGGHVKPDGTAWPARSPELPFVWIKPDGVVRATSGSTTETTERLNLTQDAMEKLAEEPVMMTQAWVPDSGGHPEKSSRPVGTRDRKEQEWTS